MKFLAKVLLLTLLAASPIFGQVAVTGSLKDITTGNVTTNVQVDFELQNYGSQIPHVIGTSTIVQVKKTFRPDNSGNISGTIYQNQIITPVGTFYRVCIVIQGTILRCNNYLINGPFDLNSAVPLNIQPVIGPNQIVTSCFPFLQLTPSSTWTVTHNENDVNVFVQTTSLLGKFVIPDDTDTSNPNVAVISWVTPSTGKALVCHGGSIQIATNQPNAIVSNPTGPQQIINNTFTLLQDVSFFTQGPGTHSGIETFTNGITTNALTDSGLTPGGCVQAGTGGLLTTPSATACGTGSGGVSSLNSLTGALTIVAGTNIAVTPSGGNTLTIDSTASGGAGTVTSVGLTTPPELSVANSPCTSACTLAATWNDEQPSTFFRGPGNNGIGGVFDGSVQAIGNSTTPTATGTPNTTHDWAFFVAQTTGSQSSFAMPGPWVNQQGNGNIGATFSNILSSTSPVTATATITNSNTWAGLLFFLKHTVATTPAVVQKKNTSGGIVDGSSVTFNSNTAIGNAILVTLVGTPASANFSTGTFTDSQGNTYTPVGQAQNGSGEVIIAALTTKITGVTTDVVTFHTTAGTFTNAALTAFELSNIQASNRTPYFGPITLADLPGPLPTVPYTKFGISNSTTCPTSGAGGSICTFTVPWAAAWADTGYAVACTGVNPSNFPSIQGVVKSTNNVIVTVQNGTANMAMVSGYSEVDCVSSKATP